MSTNSKRFLIVGGHPFNNSFTGLSVVDAVDTKNEADISWHDHYDECGGLLLVIDTHNPMNDIQVNPLPAR